MLKKYQSLVNQSIPITQYMGWSIENLKPMQITTFTPLKPNINIHGTGFAGSIYTAAMATGWTLLKNWCDSLNFAAELVAAQANICYLLPVANDFYCHAEINQDSAQYSKLKRRLANNNSCSYTLPIEVMCELKVCATLDIKFVFKCKGS